MSSCYFFLDDLDSDVLEVTTAEFIIVSIEEDGAATLNKTLLRRGCIIVILLYTVLLYAFKALPGNSFFTLGSKFVTKGAYPLGCSVFEQLVAGRRLLPGNQLQVKYQTSGLALDSILCLPFWRLYHNFNSPQIK